jgi:acetate kinase
MADLILVINAGSSSLKFSVYDIGGASGLVLSLKGQMDGIGTRPRLRARDAGGRPLLDQTFPAAEVPDVGVATGRVGAWLRERLPGALPVAVGHRVAHGGPDYPAPVAVDDGVLAALERLAPLAPLHQPHNLRPIRTIQERFPSALQVACFDTAFHRGHPDVADRYALPEALYQEGVRRYGFHGLSYEYVTRTLPSVAPEIAQGAVVIAHLGSGASRASCSTS